MKNNFINKSNNTPSIRFRGYNTPWERKKLGEICSEIGDGLHSAPVYDDNGEYYFINGNNLLMGKIFIDKNETKKVSKKFSKKMIKI